jgi:hypothetical protein
LTWDAPFVARVLTLGLIPILGVAATLYPDLANSLLQVIEPFTRALK